MWTIPQGHSVKRIPPTSENQSPVQIITRIRNTTHITPNSYSLGHCAFTKRYIKEMQPWFGDPMIRVNSYGIRIVSSHKLYMFFSSDYLIRKFHCYLTATSELSCPDGQDAQIEYLFLVARCRFKTSNLQELRVCT